MSPIVKYRQNRNQSIFAWEEQFFCDLKVRMTCGVMFTESSFLDVTFWLHEQLCGNKSVRWTKISEPKYVTKNKYSYNYKDGGRFYVNDYDCSWINFTIPLNVLSLEVLPHCLQDVFCLLSTKSLKLLQVG